MAQWDDVIFSGQLSFTHFRKFGVCLCPEAVQGSLQHRLLDSYRDVWRSPPPPPDDLASYIKEIFSAFNCSDRFNAKNDVCILSHVHLMAQPLCRGDNILFYGDKAPVYTANVI